MSTKHSIAAEHFLADKEGSVWHNQSIGYARAKRDTMAKGLPEWKVLGKHALRNALLPVVTYIGPMFAALITGSFVVEKVFGIPGIGNLFTNSILNRDYTLIMGITVFFSVILVICILVVDILYVLIDPRIKYQ